MKVRAVLAISLVSALGLLSGCDIVGKVTGISSASGAHSELVSKNEELASLEPKVEPPGKDAPKIKGKVAIVIKEGDGQARLDRFDHKGTFSEAPVGTSSLFYPAEVYAKTPEEIDTLIKVVCRNHVGSDYYTTGKKGAGSDLQSYSKTICSVSVIDYRTKTLLDSVQKGNESAPGVITLGQPGETTVYKEIADYLKGIPLDLIPRVKPTPSGDVIAISELAKLHKKSKESLNVYQDNHITVTGWGSLSKTYSSISIYDNEKETGVNYITCKIDPGDMADFAVPEREKHKFTVVGKFDANYGLMTLNQCRFIDAEKMSSK
jgi:hypothetical protein